QGERDDAKSYSPRMKTDRQRWKRPRRTRGARRKLRRKCGNEKKAGRARKKREPSRKERLPVLRGSPARNASTDFFPRGTGVLMVSAPRPADFDAIAQRATNHRQRIKLAITGHVMKGSYGEGATKAIERD